MLNGASQFRVNGIDRPTAVGNGKILFAPLKKGDEKEAEIGIDHKNGNAAVAPAFFADHGLPEKIKILSPLGDPADKYHKNTPFRMEILQIHFTRNDLHDKITEMKRRKAKNERLSPVSLDVCFRLWYTIFIRNATFFRGGRGAYENFSLGSKRGVFGSFCGFVDFKHHRLDP